MLAPASVKLVVLSCHREQCWSPGGQVLVLKDNFEVFGLGLASAESLALGLVTQVLGKTRGHTLHQSLHVLHKRLQGQKLGIMSVTDY